MFEITSPVQFTGLIGPTQFVQGRATTDHPSVVSYCRRHGYTVEPVKEAAPEPVEVPETPVVEVTPDTPEAPEEPEVQEEAVKPTRARKGGSGGN